MNLLSSLVKEKIKSAIEIGFNHKIDKVNLELFKGSSFGHFSTSISFELSKKLKKSPKEISEKIVQTIIEIEASEFEKITNINGFINFYFTKEFILENLLENLKNESFGKGNLYENQKVVVEYTDTNPFKEFHIGHFMTNSIGESIFRLVSSQSANVDNVCYSGDVGIHVAKCIYSILSKIESKQYSIQDFISLSNEKTIEELNSSYVDGSKLFENDSDKENIKQLNTLIFQISQKFPKSQGIELVNKYSGDYENIYDKQLVEKIYDKGLQESLKNFNKIYDKLGTNFSAQIFESTTSEIGAKIVFDSLGGLDKGPIFEKSDGAIIWDGKKYDRNVQVLINSKGNPTYTTKDIGLNMLKEKLYKPDLSIILTAREQEFYFKDLVEIFKQLGFKANTIHIPHGEFRNKGGKMSSRTGDIVTMNEIIQQIRQEILINFSSKKDEEFLERISEKVAISCLKYLILKNSLGSNIIYDPKTISDLTGNTGAYLLYTFARLNSVLNKAGSFEFTNDNLEISLISELEAELLVKCLMFNDIVNKAAQEFSPVDIATYTHELAKLFNFYYSENKIISDDNKLQELRLTICLIVKEILNQSLYLLGIESIDNL
jgi:arginyl-tRNA synthetase